MDKGYEIFRHTLADLRNSSEGAEMTEEELYDEAHQRMGPYYEQLDKDRVKGYLVSLILGLITLFVFWGIIVNQVADFPQIYKDWIAIGATVVLLGGIVRKKMADAKMKRTIREAEN